MGVSSPPLRLRDFCSLLLAERVRLPWEPQRVRRFREESLRASGEGWKPLKELLVVGRLSGREKRGRKQESELEWEESESCLNPGREVTFDLQFHLCDPGEPAASLSPSQDREGSPPGSIGCMSLFIWTFQCFTLVLAWRNFLWAACGAGWWGWVRTAIHGGGGVLSWSGSEVLRVRLVTAVHRLPRRLLQVWAHWHTTVMLAS